MDFVGVCCVLCVVLQAYDKMIVGMIGYVYVRSHIGFLDLQCIDNEYVTQ